MTERCCFQCHAPLAEGLQGPAPLRLRMDMGTVYGQPLLWEVWFCNVRCLLAGGETAMVAVKHMVEKFVDRATGAKKEV